MRVLLINEECGTGSTGKIAAAIAEDYQKQGHEVRIAYGRKAYVPEKYRPIAVRIGTDLGVRLHGVYTRVTDRHGLFSSAATRKFLAWATEYDPDVLWMHNIHGYYLNYELLFQWIKQRPNMEVKWTLHDCWAFTGHCVHFLVTKCERWKTGCHHCPGKKGYPASLLMDNSRDNYRRKKAAFTGVRKLSLIVPSQWLADLVGQSFLKDYPVQVVYNTINREVFKPTPGDFRKRYGLEGKFLILGVASVWYDRKGLPDFLRLAGLLDDSCRIVLVGLSEQQMKGLPKNVIGIRKTHNQAELAEIYTAADVLFNPTYEDNYPTVNLEAISCGTPVVTYRTGGSPESVVEGETGTVVERGNVNGLLEAVRTFEKADREALRRRCREYAEANFDKQERYREYLKLYEDIAIG